MALGLNLLFGYTGQISLAHASFFAIGAYTSTLLEVNTGLSFWLSTPMGILMAALIGIIVGIPTLRLRDHYLALATLSFCMVTQLFLVNTKDLTGGSEGVMGIRNPAFFGYVLKGTPYYYLVLILTLLIFIVIRNLVNSRVGLALETIRENEEAAASLGVNILYYKVMVFALAAGFAALAGSLYAHQALFISPETFGIMLSIEVLIIVVVGGLATNEGAVIGAIVMTLLPEFLYKFEEHRLLVYGVIMLLIVIFAPKGIVGLFISLKDTVQGRFRFLGLTARNRAEKTISDSEVGER
jgi:branched-chain amino acid transport system permease protein